jgi:transposase
MGELQTLPLLYPNLAGIDIGSREHYVSVPGDRCEQSVRTFGCTTPDLQEMVAWLKGCGITHAVMESTGVYWVPVATALETAGLTVALVDARAAHRLSARKTDVHDCQWIRQLYACGLLNQAFRPAPAIQGLRALWRQRHELVSLCATAIHHMQKAMELMNVQLHKVISDVTGLTGMRIMRSIAEGKQNPETLAQMAHPNCKSSREEFVKALTGDYGAEQMLALRQALQRYDLYQEQMAALDGTLERELRQTALAATADSDAPVISQQSKRSRRRNESHFDLTAELQRLTGVDLTQIEGIDALTAFTIITEQGVDMSAFPTEKHFASHLGLCPNNEITGGRVRKKRTRRVRSRAAHALRMAAQSLARSKTALGAFYRRMRARQGAGKANVATAHKLAKIVYRMLKYGEQYVQQGQEAYEQLYHDRLLKNLKKQARRIGCEVVLQATGELLS